MPNVYFSCISWHIIDVLAFSPEAELMKTRMSGSNLGLIVLINANLGDQQNWFTATQFSGAKVKFMKKTLSTKS